MPMGRPVANSLTTLKKKQKQKQKTKVNSRSIISDFLWSK